MPELEIIISAVDQTKRAFKRIRISLDEIERTSRKTASQTDKTFKGLAGAIQSASGGITGAIDGVADAMGNVGPAGIAAGAAFASFSYAIYDAVNVTQQFEQAITNAATVTGKTGKELEKAKENIRAVAEELGKTTVFSAREAANALYLVASAGQDISKIIADDLAPALNLAAGMGIDLTVTMDTLISTANQFGMQFKDIGRIADVITAAWGNSQASLEKFRYAMKYVGPIAHSLGYSLEETTAALMGLYNAGFTGEEAGTKLRGAFTRLLKPTKASQQVFKELGVSIRDSAGHIRPFIDILDDLKKAGITTTQAVTIFGDVAGPAMMALMDQGADAIREFQKELENAGGMAERVAKEQLNTFQGQIKLFQSALEGAKIEVGTALLPALTQLLKIITKLLHPLMEIGKVVYGVLKNVFAPLGDILIDIAEIFGKAGEQGSGFSLELKSLAFNLKLSLMPLKIFLIVLREIIRILKPILIPAFKTLRSVLQTINSIFGISTKEVKTNTEALKTNTSSLQSLSDTLLETGNRISLLTTLSRGFAIELQILKDVFNTLANTFIFSIQIILNTLSNLKNSSIVIITDIKNLFQSLIDIILIIPQKIGDVISSFDAMKSAAESAWESIKKAAEVVISPVKKAAKVLKPTPTKKPPTPAPAKTITKTVTTAVTSVSKAATGIVKTVGNVVSKAVDVVSGVIGGIGKALGFQQGGIVPATGIYYLHKGERVLNTRETREYDRGKAKPQVTKIINFNFDKIYLSEKYSLADLEKDMKRDYARGF